MQRKQQQSPHCSDAGQKFGPHNRKLPFVWLNAGRGPWAFLPTPHSDLLAPSLNTFSPWGLRRTVPLAVHFPFHLPWASPFLLPSLVLGELAVTRGKMLLDCCPALLLRYCPSIAGCLLPSCSGSVLDLCPDSAQEPHRRMPTLKCPAYTFLQELSHS